MQKQLNTLHGKIKLPTFMPDATYGAVSHLTFSDLDAIGIDAVVTNTLHLEQKLGSKNISQQAGINNFFSWNKPVFTDSGGYQVFSLIYRNGNKHNKITEAGCSFIDYKTGKYNLLTPEISQAIQSNIGSDVRLVLDIPTNEEASLKTLTDSIARNTRWAKRSKEAFLKLNGLTESDFQNKNIVRPLLAAVVQGGNNFELRKRSIEELKDIGFDIYCFGGVPTYRKITWKNDAPQGLYAELIAYVSEQLGEDVIKYAMGVGTPSDIIFSYQKGWQLFDCVLPTRNARHGYLYVHKGEGDSEFRDYDVLHIETERYKYSQEPLDKKCSCLCCRTVSRSYLRHLLRNKLPSGMRLAVYHNLYFYKEIIKKLQQAKS